MDPAGIKACKICVKGNRNKMVLFRVGTILRKDQIKGKISLLSYQALTFLFVTLAMTATAIDAAYLDFDDGKIKSVSKVLGMMSDSRTSYIASVTIIQRAGNAMPQIKYANKNYQRLCKQLTKLIKGPLVVISGHNYNPHSSNMTALNKICVVLST